MQYYVMRYDISSMAEDPENPGHAVGYIDPSVNAPEPMEPPFDNAQAAIDKANELSASSQGEEIEVTLANGKPYKGPRYIYRIGHG